MTKTTAARTANKLPDFLDGADEAAASTAGGGHAGEHPHAAEAAAARSDAAPAPATTNRAAWGLAAACLVGAALAIVWQAQATAFGIAPGALLACAAAFAAAAATQARVAREFARMADTAHAQQSATAALHAQVATNGAAGQGGAELDQVLLALQKQDDKTSNLSRAVKMYGQPLVEISGQTTDLVASMQQLLRRVEELAARPATSGVEPLAQALGRIEVSIAAIAQRLDDAETRKSLFRLEESTQKGLATLAHLQKGDELRHVGMELQARVDRAAATLADGLQRLGESNIGELATVVRDIQREVTGVATQVAQINAAVKNGPRAEPAPTPAAAAPAASPAPAPATPPTEGGGNSGNGGGGGYQTGARSSSGRNVLGAIARLKQMKG
ncbi:MAG: hypothetical protein ACK53T_04085 [Planctomycetota bacterium]